MSTIWAKIEEMRIMLLGFCTHPAREGSLRDLFPQLAAWGYQAVELSAWPQHACHPTRLKKTGRAELRQALGEHGLLLSAIAAHTQWVGVDEVVTQRALEYTQRCIELAAELGAPIVTTNSGAYPMTGKRHTSWDRLLIGLAGAARYAAKQGVILALEPHVGHIVFTWESARNLMLQVDSPALQINFDAAHWHATGFDDTVALEQLSSYVVHVHLRDHTFRKMPLADSYYENEAEQCAVGKGCYPLESHLDQLKRLGYQGVVSIELPAWCPISEAELSAQVVRRLLQKEAP